jgi:2-keto-3-deoxy-L-rhamnonate aldolase RhmA
MNVLREKLEKGKIKGTLISLTDPAMAEIMAEAGFDCVWIDTEHTYMSYKDVLCHLNAARSRGIGALVRLPQNDLTATKKILEMGPDAILFPMVKNISEFNTLMDMTLYPPLGTRGFGPMRAIDYSGAKAKEYVTNGQHDMMRFMQIEAVSMIDDLEEIATNPYVDGFIFGPNDLSASLDDFLNVFGEKTKKEIKRATEIIKRHGKLCGVAIGQDRQTLEYFSRFGFDMIFAGADWTYIFDCAEKTRRLLEELV